MVGFLIGFLIFIQPINSEDISPLCVEYPSAIEPDMQRRDSDFTSENALAAIDFLQFTFPGWLDNPASLSFESNGDVRISGEAGFAYANRLAVLKGYILKQQVINAEDAQRQTYLQIYCDFRGSIPYYD